MSHNKILIITSSLALVALLAMVVVSLDQFSWHTLAQVSPYEESAPEPVIDDASFPEINFIPTDAVVPENSETVVNNNISVNVDTSVSDPTATVTIGSDTVSASANELIVAYNNSGLADDDTDISTLPADERLVKTQNLGDGLTLRIYLLYVHADGTLHFQFNFYQNGALIDDGTKVFVSPDGDMLVAYM